MVLATCGEHAEGVDDSVRILTGGRRLCSMVVEVVSVVRKESVVLFGRKESSYHDTSPPPRPR